MSPASVGQLLDIIDYPKLLRKQASDNSEIEKESLQIYGEELSELEERLLSLNEDHPLPQDPDEASGVRTELEEIQERAYQLKQRRQRERKWRSEAVNEHFQSNIDEFYQELEYDDPVEHDIDKLINYVEQAKSNQVI